MTNDQIKQHADVRRRVFAVTERLKPVETTSGWRVEAHPLRKALLKAAVSYPDVNPAEFAELLEAIEGVVQYLEPQSTKRQ
jgi:hypothetical protein